MLRTGEFHRMYIASQEELEAFISRAASSEVLAIDTEFLREKTYYPKLCLLQLATDDESVIVDPLAPINLASLVPLLENEGIVKLFHAGYQDLEIILREIGVLPHPIFDTQVAAALLGHVQQIGYGALVHAVCGVKIKKADSFTDWSVRPLADSQISYALEDVEYLPQIYRSMKALLEKKGRLAWLESDFAEMVDPKNYDEDERERYKRLKHVMQLNRRQMAAAREMAAWRELEARKRDIPRKWVLTDEQIIEACKREPRSIDDLFMVRGFRDRVSTRDARELLELVVSALDSPESNWPVITESKRSEKNVDAQVDLMMSIVRLRSRQYGVAVPTLASHADLVAVARGHTDGVDILKGWRRELVGAELVRLVNGEISLRIDGGSVVVEEVQKPNR